jgi:hypothetical protein
MRRDEWSLNRACLSLQRKRDGSKVVPERGKAELFGEHKNLAHARHFRASSGRSLTLQYRKMVGHPITCEASR